MVLFPLLLRLAHAINGKASLGQYLFASFLAFATVSIPEQTGLTLIGKILFSVEVAVGYVFLVILGTLVLRKVGR